MLMDGGWMVDGWMDGPRGCTACLGVVWRRVTRDVLGQDLLGSNQIRFARCARYLTVACRLPFVAL